VKSEENFGQHAPAAGVLLANLLPLLAEPEELT
jgi:hypothetical protein